MHGTTITFVGGGNMARSLIGGIIADGCDRETIRVADPDRQQLSALHRQFGVGTSTDNLAAVEGADLVVFAVKPQKLREVALQTASAWATRKPLALSVVAGVRSGDINAWIGAGAPLVRAMPNTPALVQSGATALFANPVASEEQKHLAESLMRAVGLTVWLDDEAAMDAVTALSGSGPAYFFYVMEAMQAAGESLGLSPHSARLLTLQTAMGAAKLALESSDEVSTLRERVTSPGGTTERAIEVLRSGGLETLFRDALESAHKRAGELAIAFGSQS